LLLSPTANALPALTLAVGANVLATLSSKE
jgi:hypothetical protein